MRTLRIFLAIMTAGTVLFQSARCENQYDLVVIISIDQLPYDYLTRFSRFFGEEGFNRLIRDGAHFTNARYGHAFLLTGPSHGVICTGCYPAKSGIVGNNWHDPAVGRNIYCAADAGVRLIGTEGRPASPVLLEVPTFGDQLRLASGSASRVISISPKDRSAILMGGKRANGAYWFTDSLFVSSTYYMDSLPSWVTAFNRTGLAVSYFGRTWEPILPAGSYEEMDLDDAPYEGGEYITPAFPHAMTGTDHEKITRSYFGALWNSPFLNDLTIEFVKQAIDNEELGMRGETDLLCIGLSANDAVGHTFGPNSREVLDMTIRTDMLLAEFFRFVDDRIGLSDCLIVLTSDHGIAPIPEYLQAQDPPVPSGRVPAQQIKDRCEQILTRRYDSGESGLPLVDRVVDGNIYLNRRVFGSENLASAVSYLADSLRLESVVAAVVTAHEYSTQAPVTEVERKMYRGYFPGRSGDLIYALKPYFIDYGGTRGTDHGQPYPYDDHVPLIFFGAGVRHGEYSAGVSPADIAPTVATLLGVHLPGPMDGRVLTEALETP